MAQLRLHAFGKLFQCPLGQNQTQYFVYCGTCKSDTQNTILSELEDVYVVLSSFPPHDPLKSDMTSEYTIKVRCDKAALFNRSSSHTPAIEGIGV